MPDINKSLLYIDDNKVMLKMVGRFFEKLGYSVHLAEDGKKGIEVFREVTPDIVLVDLNMPEMDGFGVLDILSSEYPDIPVIVISGDEETADVIRALRLGAWNYYTKPIKDLALIRHAVEEALDKANLRKENKAYQKGLERKLSTIIDNFPGFVYTCDKDHRISYVNPPLTSYLGYDATGSLCHKALFGFNSPCPWCDDILPVRGQFVKQEIQSPQDGRWYRVILSPILDQNGDLWEREVILYDITERKQQILDLEEKEKSLRKENILLRSTLSDRYKLGGIIGKSKPMQEVYETILNAAASDASVIIYGESGTGKELVASAIHENSERKEQSLVYVNCGAIPENLIESEFFGYKKGAFTGANKDKPGYLDSADKGTLFLDEVGEIPLNMQVKLLRAIEGNGFTPIGGTEVKKPDVRIIAATNRDLMEEVKQGRMRQDFLYRIHIIPIHIPALRERKEDIPLLVEHFLVHHETDTVPPVSPSVTKALQQYDWPGNVRELQNTLKRFVTLKKLDFMGGDLPETAEEEVFAGVGSELGRLSLSVLLEVVEKKILLNMLDKYDFNRRATAEALQVDRKTLYRKMKHFGIEGELHK